MTEATQATTTDEPTTITISYTSFGFERGTNEEITAYELRNAETTPDELEQDMIDTVYDEHVAIDVSPNDAAQFDDVGDMLQTVYRGVERDQIDQVDRTQYRSPMIGDVFVVDDTAYVVARFGFDELDVDADVFATDA